MIRKWLVRFVLFLVDHFHIVVPGQQLLIEENRYLRGMYLRGTIAAFSTLPIPPAVLEMLDRARQGVSRIDNESADGTSGEWKRHRLLDELMQAFPHATQQDRCLAIELAVRKW